MDIKNVAKKLWKNNYFLLVFLFMCSCSLFQQQKIEEQRPIRIQDNATLSSNEYNQNQKQEEKQIIFQDPRIQQYIHQLPDLQQELLLKIAANLTIVEQNLDKIVVQWESYSSTCPQSHITHSLETGNRQYKIHLCTEKILTHQENFSLVFPKFFIECIVREKISMVQTTLPEWLVQGMIYYAMDNKEALLSQFACECMDKPGELKQWFVGINNKDIIFPQWEGYMFLLFLEDYYGKETLVTWFSKIFEGNNYWLDDCQNTFGTDIESLEKNGLHFALTYLTSRYRGAWIAYKRTLKIYLDKKYIDAIPEFKKLSIQYSGTFLESNVKFWLGMCYYRLQRYSDARSYFEEIQQDSCTYLPEMQYRLAMCYFHEKHLSQAIILLEQYSHNFPYHTLAASAQYFLAESLRLQEKHAMAIHVWKQFVKKYKNHHRKNEAYFNIIDVAFQLGWFGLAGSIHHTLEEETLTSEEKNQLQESKQLLKTLEKNARKKLQIKLEKWQQKYQKSSLAQKQAMLEEMGYIGTTSLPYLKSMAISEELLETYLITLQNISTPPTIPLFLQIAKQYPQKKQQIFTAMFQLHIPAQIFSEILSSEKDPLFQTLTWNTTPALQQQFPNILQKLNGTEQDQLYIIEQLMLHSNSDQVYVFNQLAEHGHPKAREQAIQNLLIWKHPSSQEVFQKNIQDKVEKIQILSFPGTKIWEILTPEITKNLLKINNIEFTIKILEVVSEQNTKEYMDILVESISNPHQEVRETIKKNILRLPKKRILPSLCSAFLVQDKPLYYYVTIVELLENITETSFPFRPDMTKDEKEKIISKFKNL